MALVDVSRAALEETVAALVAFLCSHEASYVNGAIYTVDGGLMA